MMKTVLSLLMVLALGACALLQPAPAQARWEGETDGDMMKQARSDLERAQARHVRLFRVDIISPGGPIITSLEIARLIRQASDSGMAVEIHAHALCASGCTLVLASGTPGHRYIAAGTLFLVHPPQAGGGFGPMRCMDRVEDPQTQEDKVTDAIHDLMVDAYVRYTGASAATVREWMTCGKELVGGPTIAIESHIADKVE